MGSITFQIILCLIVFLVPQVTVCWKKVSQILREQRHKLPKVCDNLEQWEYGEQMLDECTRVWMSSWWIGGKESTSKEWTGGRRFIAVTLPWSFMHGPQCIQHHIFPHCCTRHFWAAETPSVLPPLIPTYCVSTTPLGHWKAFPGCWQLPHRAQSLPGCCLLLCWTVVKSLSRKQPYQRFRHFHLMQLLEDMNTGRHLR